MMKSIFLGKKFLESLVSQNERNGESFSLVYTGKNFPSYGKFIAGGPTGFYKLDIYSGQPFVDLDESHKLISFDVNGWSDDSSKSGYSVELASDGLTLTIGVSNLGSIAKNNGVCSWFRFYSENGDLSIQGTIGKAGTDNDLIVTEDVILSGNSYKSFGFKLFIPSSIMVV